MRGSVEETLNELLEAEAEKLTQAARYERIQTSGQRQYLANPASGPCPVFEVGQEFILERNSRRDDFMHMLDGKFCAEAWDAISRYVYAALQGGAIMRGWTNDEKVMIACLQRRHAPCYFQNRARG